MADAGAQEGRSLRRAGLTVMVAGLLAVLGAGACSPLRFFNGVMPKDGGSALVASGIAYGEGARRMLDVYAPTHASSAPLPVIVFIYGGSWNSGTRSGYGFVGRALAARGFLVVIPDYRVVPEVHYPAFLEDNAAAVRWTIAHAGDYGADPTRVILAGHSAGAYDAAMLAVDPRWLGADRRHIRALIGLAGPYNFAPFVDKVVLETFTPVADQAATQPVSFAAPGDPPAFLATGDKDTMVRPKNSDDLAAKLTAVGVPVERRRYANLGHVGLITALAVPLRGRAPVLDDMVAFAKAHTK